MCLMARKQWGLILFFAVLSAQDLWASVFVPSTDERTLGGQTPLVIQNIASFLSARDYVRFAHTNGAIRSALGQNLDYKKTECKRAFLEKHVWKIEIKPEEAQEVVQNLEAFKQKMEKYIGEQKQGYGVDIVLYACDLRQAGVSQVLSYLVSAIKNHKCEIVKLNLSLNHLQQIPQEVYQMIFLKKFVLASNPIQFTKGMFSGMPPIKKLDLTNTKISRIPDGLFDGLQSVSYLNLYSNDLTEFSVKSIKSLCSLRILDLIQNCLQRLDSDLTEHPALQKIDISDNPMLISQMRKNRGIGSIAKPHFSLKEDGRSGRITLEKA